MDQLSPHVDTMFNFIAMIFQKEDVSNEMLKSAVGLVGDLCQAIGKPLANHVAQPIIVHGVRSAVQRAHTEQDSALKETADYTQGVSFIWIFIF